MAVRQKMTARSRDDQVAVHLAVRDRNLILGANGHSVAVHSVRTRSHNFFGLISKFLSGNFTNQGPLIFIRFLKSPMLTENFVSVYKIVT